jgi:hypothetical protein
MGTWLALAAFCAVPAFAGQIYGSIVSQGKPLAKADVLITCAGEETHGTTIDDGTFKITVTKTGRCTFSLPMVAGKPSAVVFSVAKPAMYDFDLVKDAAGANELKIR